MTKLIRFLREEEGLETSEYAIMGALIVIALIVAITTLRDAIASAFTRIAGVVNGAGGS